MLSPDMAREVGGGQTSRQHHSVGSESSAISEGDMVRRECGNGYAEVQLDPCRCKCGFDLAAGARPEVGPDDGLPVDEHDPQPLVIAAMSREAITQLQCQLDAGEAGANHRDGRRGDRLRNARKATVECDRVSLAVDGMCEAAAWDGRPA